MLEFLDAVCLSTPWCAAGLLASWAIYEYDTQGPKGTALNIALAGLAWAADEVYLGIACIIDTVEEAAPSGQHCFWVGPEATATPTPVPSTGPASEPPRAPVLPLPPPRDDGCKSIGYWDLSNEGGSRPGDRSWQFQQKVTGESPELGVYLNHDPSHTEFDGCRDGVPLEAKGCRYAYFFSQPWWWTKNSGDSGFQCQATRQNSAAAVESLFQSRPVQVDWQFAEPAAQHAADGYFAAWGLSLLRTTHTDWNCGRR